MKLGMKMKEGPAAKEHFPSFSINDEKVDEFLKQHKAKLGDEITATVCLKVTHLSSDEYGKRVGFDMTEMYDIKEDKPGKAKAQGQKSNKDEEADVMKGMSGLGL